MPNNLYALVGDRAEIDLRRVQVAHQVQGQLAGLFHAYRDEFLDGVDDEIPFGSGDWKADDDEILFLDENAQAQAVAHALEAGPLHLDPVEPNNFENLNVRALIFCPVDDGSTYFVQYFYSSQHLSRRGFTLKYDGETFTELNEPGFSVGKKIDALYVDGRLKFKSFEIVKRIFDVLHSYVEASDEQIGEFSELPAVHIEDLEAFKEITNQVTRKLISAIAREGTLQKFAVQDIADRANELDLAVNIANGRIVFPANKNALKQLLRFLDHGIYSSPLAPEMRFMANSKRPI